MLFINFSSGTATPRRHKPETRTHCIRLARYVSVDCARRGRGVTLLTSPRAFHHSVLTNTRGNMKSSRRKRGRFIGFFTRWLIFFYSTMEMNCKTSHVTFCLLLPGVSITLCIFLFFSPHHLRTLLLSFVFSTTTSSLPPPYPSSLSLLLLEKSLSTYLSICNHILSVDHITETETLIIYAYVAKEKN